MAGFSVAPGNRYWRHPQGGTITVTPEGIMDARDWNGKKKKTSATPTSLLAGHGEWREVYLTTSGRELTTEELRAYAEDLEAEQVPVRPHPFAKSSIEPGLGDQR